jgi:type II secretion system protein N
VKDRWKKWLRWALYPVAYLVVFLLAFSVLFPYETLRSAIVTQFNAQQRLAGSPQELAIDELGWYWFTGVRAKGVRLASAAAEPGKPPTEIAVDEAKIRLSVLGLLVGRRTVSFSLSALGGTVDGSFTQSGKDRAVEVKLDGIDLKQFDMITQTIGLPVEGKAYGTIDIALPEGKASKGTGKVSLEIRDVAIGDGKAKLKGALEWPKMSVGQLTFEADAKEGVLKVTKFEAKGKDLELGGEGRVQMREIANESTLDMQVKFKIADTYRGKSDITKSLFGAPGSPKGGDVELFVPEMKQAKRSDGFYAFHVAGLLGRPRFEPQGMQGAGSAIPGMAPFR